MTESINVTDYTPAAQMAKLYAALAAAQGAFLPIVKNRSVEITMKTGGRYKFRYADLEEILSKTRPALAANGLALVQRIEQSQGGASLVCCLTHADGGVMTSEIAIPGVRDLGDPKSFGAAITYLRRYLVTAMLGVAADDDLDEDGQEMTGMGQSQGHAPQKETAMPARRSSAASAPAPAPASAPASDTVDRPVTAGEMKWLDNKLGAKGWTIGHAIEQAGLDPMAEGAQLMLSQFNAIKKVL